MDRHQKTIGHWIYSMHQHYFCPTGLGFFTAGCRFYFRDAIAAFLIRFSSPYGKGGDRDYGFLVQHLSNLQKYPAGSLNYKFALEYLGLPKDWIFIKDRRKNVPR